jgi:hypothetical protein
MPAPIHIGAALGQEARTALGPRENCEKKEPVREEGDLIRLESMPFFSAEKVHATFSSFNA